MIVTNIAYNQFVHPEGGESIDHTGKCGDRPQDAEICRSQQTPRQDALEHAHRSRNPGGAEKIPGVSQDTPDEFVFQETLKEGFESIHHVCIDVKVLFAGLDIFRPAAVILVPLYHPGYTFTQIHFGLPTQ